MGIILGIDYGTKFIGVAASDETHTIAGTLPAVRVPHGRTPLSALLKAIAGISVDRFLIGLPTGLEGKPTRISREVEEFAAELQAKTGTGFTFWNETLSSQIASGMQVRKGSNDSHSQAAKIILQEYLDHTQLQP